MQFNGANIAEKFDLSANGTRVRFTRDVGNIVMDLNGVEGFNLTALGGADTITVNDLTGTGRDAGEPRPGGDRRQRHRRRRGRHGDRQRHRRERQHAGLRRRARLLGDRAVGHR